jgi:hypothetical protein
MRLTGRNLPVKVGSVLQPAQPPPLRPHARANSAKSAKIFGFCRKCFSGREIKFFGPARGGASACLPMRVSASFYPRRQGPNASRQVACSITNGGETGRKQPRNRPQTVLRQPPMAASKEAGNSVETAAQQRGAKASAAENLPGVQQQTGGGGPQFPRACYVYPPQTLFHPSRPSVPWTSSS